MRLPTPLPQILLAGALLLAAPPARAQDFREPHQPLPQFSAPASGPCLGHYGGSPFSPPQPNDMTFVVDQDYGLDSGCSYRLDGPLVFNIPVGRVVGDVALLKSNGLIGDYATLRMPAFDVDFDAIVPPYAPERDRVYFNGHLVNEIFLNGLNGAWILNTFQVPIEWVNFPTDPGEGGTVQPENNTIRIEIDVANSEEVWCTSIDWAALTIEVVRPVVMAHGILSSGVVWNDVWLAQLQSLGIKYGTPGNHGNLDSIVNNAAKIGDEVAAAKARFGVDKVVLVGHSKGGLDSRQYTENNQDVEQVIQLGTPNGGSPLADALQAGAIVGLGLPATIIVNALAGPAGVQLTTPYMSSYNSNHGYNPDVTYTALAGDYDPGPCGFFGFGCLIDKAMLAIAGRGDTIVPVWSVHALPYTSNLLLPTFGANEQAKHTSIEKSQLAFNLVQGRVKRKGTPVPSTCPGNPLLASLTPMLTLSDGGYRNTLTPLNATAGGTPTPQNRSATVVGVLTQGQVETHSLFIDAGPNTSVIMFYPSGNVDMALISPTGVRFDAASIAGMTDVAIADMDILGGRVEVISFQNMPLGVWSVEVSAPTVTEPAGSVSYALSAWFENPTISLTGELPTPAVPVGAPLPLIAHPLDGTTPITGATAFALVVTPGGVRTTVPLNDAGLPGDAVAGDGAYGGLFTGVTEAGTYPVVFVAQSVGPPAFSRETYCLATASVGGSTLQGTFLDSGVDLNGNTFFDNLTVTANMLVATAGRYRVFATLRDSAGNEHQASTEADLTPGAQTMALPFDGRNIFQNRVDGPYTLSRISLSEVRAGGEILPLQTLLNAYQTAPYAYSVFEHSPISLTGTGSAQGVDLNGNARFDRLDVVLGCEVQLSGFYQWSARLVDLNDVEIGLAAGGANLSAGLNSFGLGFDGTQIGSHGVDGPYIVRDLLLYGMGDSFIGGVVFTTAAFLASDFEGFGIDLTPPALTVKLTPATLTPADHTLRTIIAQIVVNDDQDPHPRVRLVSITSNEPDSLGPPDVPHDIQGAAFGTGDKDFKLRAERASASTGRIYTVVYEASDVSGNVATWSTTVVVPVSGRGYDPLPRLPQGITLGEAPATLTRVAGRSATPPIEMTVQLPVASEVNVAVYDLFGRRVRDLQNGNLAAGDHSVAWDGRDDAGQSLSQGIYFLRLVSRGDDGRDRRSVLKVALVR